MLEDFDRAGRARILGILTLVLESSIRLSKLDTSNPKQA